MNPMASRKGHVASQITGNLIVCSTAYFQAKNILNPTLLAFCQGNPSDSPHKEPIMRKVFLGHDIIMLSYFQPDTLLSDVGGTIGLYLGLSIAALFEFLELLWDLLHLGLKKCFYLGTNGKR